MPISRFNFDYYEHTDKIGTLNAQFSPQPPNQATSKYYQKYKRSKYIIPTDLIVA